MNTTIISVKALHLGLGLNKYKYLNRLYTVQAKKGRQGEKTVKTQTKFEIQAKAQIKTQAQIQIQNERNETDRTVGAGPRCVEEQSPGLDL